jgi:hypothetical protein
LTLALPAAATWPAWSTTVLPWLGVIAVLLCAAGVVLLGALLTRLRAAEASLAPLATLESLKRSLDRIVEERDDLDLRRLEHVLIDIRDTQKRVEDGIVATLEARQQVALASGGPAASTSPVELADRVVTRLLALGYERVLLVTPHDELAKFAQGDGEVVVEARRDGSICKGRVLVRDGRITELQIQPAYSAFP